MRLFWKLFCAMVAVTAAGCSVLGFVLIDSQFQTSLDREVASLYQENDLLRYALSLQLEAVSAASLSDLSTVASEMGITAGGSAVAFRLSAGDGQALSSAGTMPAEGAALIAQLGDGERGWELVPAAGGRYWLHAASPLSLLGETVYLENCREVTSLFTAREGQYDSFLRLMPALALGAAGAAFLVAALMLRPLGRLSEAARRMAAGELDQRVEPAGDDEIGQLGRDFNAMAQRLEAQVEELTAVARRQEDFIGSFAHELKTPLTSIIGYADLLRSRPTDRERAAEYAGYIFREGRRLEALSRKLLDMIVLEHGDLALRSVPLDTFLERAGTAMHPALERAGLTLTVLAEPAPIRIDPDLMETVLLNLLDNARKASSPGGTIRLEGCREGEDCRIDVIDTGKGIPPEELARVTEAFYMVDKSRSRAQGGAGLGLAVCRRIVELHGGTMELDSAPGRGTRVTVRLRGGDTPCEG